MQREVEYVRINEIDKHIELVGIKVRDGILRLIKQGVPAEYPKALNFEMKVLVEFEAMTLTDQEVSNSSETQGGHTSATQKTGGGEQQTASEKRTTHGDDSHTQNGDSITQTKQ